MPSRLDVCREIYSVTGSTNDEFFGLGLYAVDDNENNFPTIMTALQCDRKHKERESKKIESRKKEEEKDSSAEMKKKEMC